MAGSVTSLTLTLMQCTENCAEDVNEFYDSVFFYAYYIDSKIDFTIYDKKPARSTEHLLQVIQMNPERFVYQRMLIRKNFVSTSDDFL